MPSTPRPEGLNSAGFVFDDADATAPRKILDVVPADLYFVSYTDGESKKQTRLAVRAPGSKSSFLFQEKIQGQFVATVASDWFQSAFFAKLKEMNIETVEDEGPEGAEQL